MKKYYYLFAALLVCLPVACNMIEEEEETPQTPTISYIRANGNEDGTKGSVDGSTAAFTWNTGDRIAVWAGEYKISQALEAGDDGKSTVDFGFTDLTDGSRANFAIFPASLVWDGSGIRSGSASSYTSSSLKLTLPDSYTLAEVENNVSPTPMIATNAPDGDLAFMALCPLLRITVVNIPKQTKRIEFDFNGNKVQGEFELTDVNPGVTAIATSATEGIDDIITVTMADNTTWHDNLVVNLPVPTGTYGNITITAYDAVSGGLPVLTLTTPIKSSAAWAPTRKSSRKMTATLPVFTIGEKKVTLAPGNLQYQASTGTWRFAEHQYDYVGTGGGHIKSGEFEMDGFGNVTGSNNVLIASDYDGWIDLFGWGTSGWPNTGDNSSNDETWKNYQPWSHDKTDRSSDYPNNKFCYGPNYNASNPHLQGSNANGDWGVYNIIGDYSEGIWRTWTQDEFISLNSRVTSTSGFTKGDNKNNARYIYATVNDVNGLILFPDYYVQPKDAVPTYAENVKFNTVRGSYSEFSVDKSAWSKMEAAGAIFLPAAGDRFGTSTNYAYGSVAPYGSYWYSTSGGNGGYARYMRFNIGSFSSNTGEVRYAGFSVRLIRDLN